VRFAAYTGLRAGEIAGLTVRDLDFLRSIVEVNTSATEVNGQMVHGPTKNYQRRSVPLPPFLRDELAAYPQDRPHDPADPVFTAPAGGPFRHKNFYPRHFKRAVVQAGLPESVRFHDYADLRVMPTWVAIAGACMWLTPPARERPRPA